jgi:hypothetical protein
MSDPPELVHVDPATPRTRRNVRTNLQLTPEFLDSIEHSLRDCPGNGVSGPTR